MAVNSYREDEFMENTDKKKIMRRLKKEISKMM